VASTRAVRSEPTLTRANLGFLLAKATQAWNEQLAAAFAAADYSDVRPSYGSLLVPLYEEDGLRMGELAERARLSKQTLTTLARSLEQAGLITREVDLDDARAQRIFLTKRAREFEPVAAAALRQLEQRVTRRLGRDGSRELSRALALLIQLDE
jgi:DNA-binding MarR family transcriptional regulator